MPVNFHEPTDEINALKHRIQELESALQEEKSKSQKLEADLQSKGGPATSREIAAATVDVALNEADATLRRLVQRIAMILQAEKIVIMFYDREKGELISIPPAYNVDDEHLRLFRVRATQGISGQVFREMEPVIFHDATADNRTQKDLVGLMGVNNGVCVPLVIEKRDDEDRVIDRTTIGVVHAFNKRHGEDFIDEDVRLLERMAKNVGSIVANLQLYREVVEEREELLQTFESLSAGLILVSPEGRISQINSTARAIFQVGAEALGKDYREVLKNETLEGIFGTSRGAGAEGQAGEFELSNQTSSRYYQVQTANVSNEDGKHIGTVAIITDVTEIKNIERMKSSFVAMASHELRTPLTAIKGFSSTLLEGIDDDIYEKEEQKEFLGIVVHECDRLRRLIDDLLNTSRIEAGESLKPNYSTFNLPEMLKKVQMVQQQATQKHELKVDIQGEIPEIIVGDQDKFDQILTNLLNNAIKYSPDGGDIVIHASADEKDLLIGVEDHGMGIPSSHVNKVFERFHRVDNEDNRKIYGTGLGLFLVKHLVEEVHMGHIWCESELGKGSTFWFRMPKAIDIEEAKAAN